MKNAHKTAITCATAACIAMVVPAVKKSEGYWPTVKVDTVGTGRPCTGGYGETEGVKCGETHSETYWSERLKLRLADEYDHEIGKCITVELPDSARAAMITTAYNAGPKAVCGSPMVALMNAGKVREGCNALLTSKVIDGKLIYTGWYIRAQGRVVKGLINRRRDDRKMCLEYLKVTPKVTSPCDGPGRYDAMRAGLNCSEGPKPAPVAAPGYPCGEYHCEPPKKAWWQK